MRGFATQWITIVMLAACSGCASPESRIAERLDDVEQKLEEWGTVTMSGELLVQQDGQFSADLDVPVEEYVRRARSSVNGGFSRSQETSFRGELSGGVARDKLLKDSAPPSQLANAPTSTAAAVFSEGEFRPFLDLLESTPQLSEGDALKIGFSNKIQERILRYMTGPGKIAGNQVLIWGIVQVNCNPGWRTRSGYIADLSVATEYYMSAARFVREAGWRSPTVDMVTSTAQCPTNDLPEDAERLARTFLAEIEGVRSSHPSATMEAANVNSIRRWLGVAKGKVVFGHDDNSQELSLRPAPIVASVFPLVDAQILDLANSERSQVAWLTYVSGLMQKAGMTAEARLILDYVTRLQTDARTISPRPVVSCYTNGSTFGYQILPAVAALSDPTNESAGAGLHLQPTSFPALVLFVCERKDVETWDGVHVSVNSHWIPLEERHWFKRIFVDCWLYGDKAPWKRLTNADRLQIARKLDEAIGIFPLTGLTAQESADELGEEIATERLELAKSSGRAATAARLAARPYSPKGSVTKSWEEFEIGSEIRRRYLALKGKVNGYTLQLPLPARPDAVRTATLTATLGQPSPVTYTGDTDLGGRPKPAIRGHLKTGQRS